MHFQIVIDSGFVPYLVNFLDHENEKVVEASIKALGRLCSGNLKQAQVVLNNDVFKYLPQILSQYQDKKIIHVSPWAKFNVDKI